MNLPFTFGGLELLLLLGTISSAIIGKSVWDARMKARRLALKVAVADAERLLNKATIYSVLEIVRAIQACANRYIIKTQRRSTTSSIETKYSLQDCTASISEAGDDYKMVVQRQITLSLPGGLVVKRTVKIGEPVAVELNIKMGAFDELTITRTAFTELLFSELAIMERTLASCAAASLNDIIREPANEEYMRYACALAYYGTVSHTRDSYKRTGDYTVVSDLGRIGKGT